MGFVTFSLYKLLLLLFTYFFSVEHSMQLGTLWHSRRLNAPGATAGATLTTESPNWQTKVRTTQQQSEPFVCITTIWSSNISVLGNLSTRESPGGPVNSRKSCFGRKYIGLFKILISVKNFDGANPYVVK